MIKIVNGNLLEAKEDIIAHQVNCMGVMGSGVAKQIREKYPQVYRNYLAYISPFTDMEDKLLGNTLGVYIEDNSKIVINMFAQHKYGYDGKQYTDTEKLFTCLERVRRVAEENNMSVAMPYLLASDRGGADWKEVEELILTSFDGYEVTLYKL